MTIETFNQAQAIIIQIDENKRIIEALGSIKDKDPKLEIPFLALYYHNGDRNICLLESSEHRNRASDRILQSCIKEMIQEAAAEIVKLEDEFKNLKSL
jgi:hypothetical protein